MVGPGGCFVRAADGATTLEPTQALIALHDAGVALSLVSGRTRAQLQEAARIFGADGFIAEMGAIVGWDHGRRSSMLTGQTPPEFSGPLVAQLESLGLVDALLAEYEGRLEHHAPWHLGTRDRRDDARPGGRRRGQQVARREGLRLAGARRQRTAEQHRDGRTRRAAAHLPPDGARASAKASASPPTSSVAASRASDAVAVGDSLSDLEMAPHVERFFLVSNGAEVPDIRTAAEALPNVTICDGPLGAGWAEAARWCVRPR